MNNKDRVFSGQTFSKVQPVHGYYYDENGERQFGYVGDDLIYDRIQEANNSTDMQQIKSQLVPTVGKDETVDKYFKMYGDIDDFAEEGDNDETITNQSVNEFVDKTQKLGGEDEDKSSSKSDETSEKFKESSEKGGEAR